MNRGDRSVEVLIAIGLVIAAAFIWLLVHEGMIGGLT